MNEWLDNAEALFEAVEEESYPGPDAYDKVIAYSTIATAELLQELKEMFISIKQEIHYITEVFQEKFDEQE